MSYTISLFRKEVKEQNQGFDFLEDQSKIPDFTAEQFQKLKRRLLTYKFEIETETNDYIVFNFKGGQFGIQVTLFSNQLSFSSGFNEDGIFEIAQTASEFTDSGEFAKLDMQEGKWETWGDV
ncbi:MAG: hypothetical protein DI538_08525 [Azospira oryzae]|jgi:hypothetical protein|nr:hypothetical protein [Cytophaga sp.]PZR38867.1 MAG: hypothetical protein DI538_08525 [Azospira oryzae]